MKGTLIDLFKDRDCAVSTRDLSKSFGLKRALHRLNLAVPQESVYILAGANGAGKSTMLKLLLDLVRPSSGSATVFGISVQKEGPLARAHMGYVAEHIDFPPARLTVAQLMRHHAVYFSEWDWVYCRELCSKLEIDTKLPYGSLSKGQARRVQLVLALSHKPPLLLLDEPTDGLDPVARDKVLSLLAGHLAMTPTTVIYATHILPETEGLGDALGILEKGELKVQLDRDTLQNKLFEVRVVCPEKWLEPVELEEQTLHRQEFGKERLYTLWGETGQVKAWFAGEGVQVQNQSSLSFSEGIKRLLTLEGL